MITAEQCEKAAELLAERADLVEPLADMRATKKVRIAYQVRTPYEVGATSKAVIGKPHPAQFFWRDGPEAEIIASLRKLLLAGIEEGLAAIDAKLRALGVEPPADGGAA